MALHHHAERIADQQNLDASGVGNLREAGIVTSEHDDFVAALLEFLEMRNGVPHITPG